MSLRLSHAQIVLAVAGGLLLLVNFYMAVTYLGVQDQRNRLAGQLRLLETTLQGLQQAQAAQSGAGDVAFPKNPPGVELTDAVVRAARESGTEVLGLHSSAVGTEQLDQGTYRVVKVNLRLRADQARLADFFARLEAGGVSTMVFDNIDVSSSGDQWEVSLDLLAYAQGA